MYIRLLHLYKVQQHYPTSVESGESYQAEQMLSQLHREMKEEYPDDGQWLKETGDSFREAEG